METKPTKTLQPKIEDSGRQDCALASHSIQQAFLSVATAAPKGIKGKIMENSEASTLLKRKRQKPLPCPKRDETEHVQRPGSSSVPVEGGSSYDETKAVTEEPQRFVTFVLPDDLPSDEEIRRQAPSKIVAIFMMMKRDTELITRVNIERMNELKAELQNGPASEAQKNSELKWVDNALIKLKEANAAARMMPSFNFVTRDSRDQEKRQEVSPLSEVTTVASYCTRKMGKKVFETSVVVAKKNPSTRRM